ncbi:MAG: CvpA family protein [Patescibacteria group bacterium]|jgi:uncharacterized membrane protein required for colicin V production|nr:CvpA family protein [Patescibacteria group bacterium]
MYLTILDLVLVFIVFIFVAFGFAMGLVQTVGALVGVVLGAWLAGIYYDSIAVWLSPFMLGNDIMAKIVAFILIFTIINRLSGLVFWIINKFFNILSIIPFAKSLNRILGALLALVEGILTLGVILYFAGQFEISEWWQGIISGSIVAGWLIEMARILTPLLPQILDKVTSMT